jgi:hypothetical protein
MIRLTKKDPTVSSDYNSLYWLTSVQMTKDDTRHHMVTVHIDSGVAVKTDGARIHLACLLGDFPNGDYEIIKRTKSELILNMVNDGSLPELSWPDWEMVFDSMPVPNNGSEPNICVNVDQDFMGRTLTRFFMDLYSKDFTGPAIDAFFIETSFAGFEYDTAVYFTDEDHPMFIVDADLNRAAALMPFRL